MSQLTRDEDDVTSFQRPPSPPPHTTFAARGIHPPTFSAFKPRDYRYPSPHSFQHLAWNCDGKKLAVVGIDKAVRIWNPEKSLEPRQASVYSGAHSDDIDHISWNPTHPELFCTSSQRDRRIVFWDARQSRHIQSVPLKFTPSETCYSPNGRHLLCASPNKHTYFLELTRGPDETKETWKCREVPPAAPAATQNSQSQSQNQNQEQTSSNNNSNANANGTPAPAPTVPAAPAIPTGPAAMRDREASTSTSGPTQNQSQSQSQQPQPQPGTLLSIPGVTGIFNHTGDGVVTSYPYLNTIFLFDYPACQPFGDEFGQLPAHVGGCAAFALDPRGTYLATGGTDSIVNLFDTNDWLCTRTITVCEHAINKLSFSHDGEYLAIASDGPYIDIAAVETCQPLHRIPALGPCMSVAWHPSRYVLAYCGQTKSREGGPPPTAVISTFGMLD
ncbi:hypothetical protein CC2G_010099 [Coprinopsis cinerea AmutBmut pab1-1]|nr:hypothetical protein CC2G_010099 [Coprinopsis cinerea AmutBmut pab1-1]